MDQTPPMLSSSITSSRPWALKQVPRCARMSTAAGPGSSSALPRKRNSAANRLNSQNEGDDHERICPPRPSGEPVCAERVSRVRGEGRPIPDRAHRSERLRGEVHLKLHPFVRVPILQHGDYRLYETQAILRYTDALVPNPSLQPTDPRTIGRMNQIIGINDWYLFPLLSAGVVFHVEGGAWLRW